MLNAVQKSSHYVGCTPNTKANEVSFSANLPKMTKQIKPSKMPSVAEVFGKTVGLVVEKCILKPAAKILEKMKIM